MTSHRSDRLSRPAARATPRPPLAPTSPVHPNGQHRVHAPPAATWTPPTVPCSDRHHAFPHACPGQAFDQASPYPPHGPSSRHPQPPTSLTRPHAAPWQPRIAPTPLPGTLTTPDRFTSSISPPPYPLPNTNAN